MAALKAQGILVDESLAAAGETPGYAAAVDQYAAAAAALALGEPDGLLVESFSSIDDVLAAVEGARRACSLPVVVTMTFAAGPVAPAEAARLLVQAGAAAVGCNCMDVDAGVRVIEEMRPAVQVPLVARPSAGIPVEGADGQLVWPLGPEDFAEASVRLLKAGASVIGSCCGSTPACTGAIFATVGGLELPER